MLDSYNTIPIYYWYETKEKLYDVSAVYIKKGKTYVGFFKEAPEALLNTHNLRYVGRGDMDWISHQ